MHACPSRPSNHHPPNHHEQKDGKWLLFDDDKLSFKTEEEILNLNGGGDWHMAYLLLYREVTVPSPEQLASLP